MTVLYSVEYCDKMWAYYCNYTNHSSANYTKARVLELCLGQVIGELNRYLVVVADNSSMLIVSPVRGLL